MSFMENYTNSSHKVIPIFSVSSTSGQVNITKTEQQKHWQELVEQLVQKDIRVTI